MNKVSQIYKIKDIEWAIPRSINEGKEAEGL